MKEWMLAGAPAHWLQVLGIACYAVLEWVLPRMDSVKGNSMIEIVGNILKPMFEKWPLVGWFINAIASPPVEALPLPKKDEVTK